MDLGIKGRKALVCGGSIGGLFAAAALRRLGFQGGNILEPSAGVGHFRQIESEAADVLQMAPGHTLPFTPANGDRVYAVEATYVDWDVAENLAHGSHELLRVTKE